MGYYIEQFKDGTRWKSPRGKANALIADGAVEIPVPDVLVPNLVCVIENGPFDAACFVYNDKELKECKYSDGRRKRWLIYEGSLDIARISADLTKYEEWDK